MLYLKQLLSSAMQGPSITCNQGGNIPVNISASVPAGTTITFLWTDWTSDHPGPSELCTVSCSQRLTNPLSYDLPGQVPQRVGVQLSASLRPPLTCSASDVLLSRVTPVTSG